MNAVNSSLVGTLENYMGKADTSKKRFKTKKKKLLVTIIQQILPQLPEEWTQKTEDLSNKSWTDMYDNYHPAYTVSITQYFGKSSNLEFTISQRLPDTKESGCSVSNTYQLRITKKGKEIFDLTHLTNYDWNTEGSILAKKLFDIVEKKYLATQKSRK